MQPNIIYDLHKRLHQIGLLSLSSSNSNRKRRKKNPNLNTKHKGEEKPYLKETVGVGISNLNAKNPTWSQLSIFYKIKTGTTLIKKKNKEQK